MSNEPVMPSPRILRKVELAQPSTNIERQAQAALSYQQQVQILVLAAREYAAQPDPADPTTLRHLLLIARTFSE